MTLLADSGRTEEAIESGLEAEAIEQSLPSSESRPLSSRRRLEALLRRAGRTDEADAVKQRAAAIEASD